MLYSGSYSVRDYYKDRPKNGAPFALDLYPTDRPTVSEPDPDEAANR
jgi:hypothetical protein